MGNTYVLKLGDYYYTGRTKDGIVIITDEVEESQIFDIRSSATLFARSLPGAWQVQVF